MNVGNDRGNGVQGGGFRDEDLERALKLSLNPEEQMSKEQQEFILACSLSKLEAKPNASCPLKAETTRGKVTSTTSISEKTDNTNQDASKDDEVVQGEHLSNLMST